MSNFSADRLTEAIAIERMAISADASLYLTPKAAIDFLPNATKDVKK